MKNKKRTTHILSGGCKDSYVSEVLHGIWKCLQLIVSLLIRLTQRIDALSDLYRPPMSKYTDIVDFVRVIMSDHEHCTKCNIKSIPKAVRFIRFEVKPDSSYFEKCVEARECVKRLAKKCDDGEEKAWRSIQKMAQPNRTMRRKRKRLRNAPPGPVKIPDASWALGISPTDGVDFWNNSFPGDPCQPLY